MPRFLEQEQLKYFKQEIARKLYCIYFSFPALNVLDAKYSLFMLGQCQNSRKNNAI